MTAFTQIAQTNGHIPLKFPVGLNYTIKGKVPKDDPNPGKRQELIADARNWSKKDVTPQALADHISQGYPWMPVPIDAGAKRRKAIYCNSGRVIAIDVDGGMTIEQALQHPFLSQYACLGIESAGSKVYNEKTNPDCHEKFRIVFALPPGDELKGHEEIRRIYDELVIPAMAVADPACKDSSRYFYGAPGRVPFLLQEVRLPEDWREQMQRMADATRQREDEQKAKVQIASINLSHVGAESGSLSDVLHRDIYPRLSLDQVFSWAGHNFKKWSDGTFKGCCPWHESQSGTSFYVDHKNEGWVWRCPSCDVGGGAVEYIQKLKHGVNAGSAKGKEFVAIVKELAGIVGVTLPDFERESTGKGGAPTRQTLPVAGLPEAIMQAMAQGLSPSQLQLKKIEIRSSYSTSEREFNELWALLEQEYLSKDSDAQADLKSQVEQLIDARSSRINLEEVLPPKLASYLTQTADWQCLRPEVYLVALLCVAGSLAKNGTRLTLQHALDFNVSPNLFGAIVAEPSQKKSPIIQAVATRPLRRLLADFRSEHEGRQAIWEQSKASAKQAGAEFNEAEPALEVPFFTNSTGESILAQAGRVPTAGILSLKDELAGHFKSANQYRNGRGSDEEDLLEYYDGNGGITLRVDGVRNDVEALNYGILGTLQPAVLKKFLGDCSDGNGKWARFFFVSQPVKASTLPDDVPGFDLIELLYRTYRRIHDFEAKNYHLTNPAFKFFQQTYNQLEQRREQEANPALRAVIGKTAGRIGKIALCLHLLEAASSGEQPTAWIEESTLRKAFAIAMMAIDQIRSLYGEFGGEEMPSTLANIIELSRRKGAIKARDVQWSSRALKGISPAEIRQMFADLQAQGWGELEGTGAKISFKAFLSRQMSTVDGLSTELSTARSIDAKGFQETVDTVDTVNTFTQSPNLSKGDALPPDVNLGSASPDRSTSGDSLRKPSTVSTVLSNPCPVSDSTVDNSDHSSVHSSQVSTVSEVSTASEVQSASDVHSSQVPTVVRAKSVTNPDDVAIVLTVDGRGSSTTYLLMRESEPGRKFSELAKYWIIIPTPGETKPSRKR